jgi:hypothetical protein
MIDIKTFEKHFLALELLKRNALIAIIHQVTGIPIKILRETYKAIYGHSSQRGKPKESTRGLTRTLKSYKEVTLFAVYFNTVNTKENEDLIQKVINAFDLYKQLSPASLLDFSGAWVVANDMNERVTKLIECHCGAAVLIHARDEMDDRCLVCKSTNFGDFA